MAFPADDVALEAELVAMYDEAVSKKKGEAQLLAIIAQQLIEVKTVLQTTSGFEWPVTP